MNIKAEQDFINLLSRQHHISNSKQLDMFNNTKQLDMFNDVEFSFDTTQREIEYIYDMVKNSSYVFSNIEYKEKANKTTITFDEDDNTINAYATSHRYPNHDIHIFAGLSFSSKLMAIALANFVENKNDVSLETLRQACDYIGQVIKDKNGEFTALDVANGIELLDISMTPIIKAESNSYWFGSILSVVGHELGHICLSHTVRGDWSNSVSRNDERQADLFAYSVVSTTPFAKYNVLSTLFTEIVFAWMSKGNNGPATTHPHAKERVMNTINSNEELLKGYGITIENILDFLP